MCAHGVAQDMGTVVVTPIILNHFSCLIFLNPHVHTVCIIVVIYPQESSTEGSAWHPSSRKESPQFRSPLPTVQRQHGTKQKFKDDYRPRAILI